MMLLLWGEDFRLSLSNLNILDISHREQLHEYKNPRLTDPSELFLLIKNKEICFKAENKGSTNSLFPKLLSLLSLMEWKHFNI